MLATRYLVIAVSLLVLVGCGSVFKTKPDEGKVAPPNQSALVSAADATRNSGRFADALQIYGQILVADKKSDAARYGMAECFLALGHPVDARSNFNELMPDPQFRPLALQGMGIANLALGNRDDASRELLQAVSLDPKLWRAFNALALLSDWKRDFETAQVQYNRALAIRPDSSVLLNNLGYSRLLAGHADEAIALFHRALSTDPSGDTIQNNLRLAMAIKGDYADATRNIPNDKEATVLNNVGFIAMRRGDLSTAESLLWRAMDEDPVYDAIAAKNIEQVNSLKTSTQ